MREIIFLRANYFMGHFKGYFEGAKTFLTPKFSTSQRVNLVTKHKNSSADFFGSAGHKVGGIPTHLMSRSREKCGRFGNWAWIY
jgi:hypothetical protein